GERFGAWSGRSGSTRGAADQVQAGEAGQRGGRFSCPSANRISFGLLRRRTMRSTFTKAMLALVSSGLATMAAAAAPRPAADQPKTMEEVIDRVTANENKLNQEIRKYSPLVETYIQNLKPDAALGFVPAGDKYFLGKANFDKGVNLDSLSDTDNKGKKIFHGVGNFFSFAMQYLPD